MYGSLNLSYHIKYIRYLRFSNVSYPLPSASTVLPIHVIYVKLKDPKMLIEQKKRQHIIVALEKQPQRISVTLEKQPQCKILCCGCF